MRSWSARGPGGDEFVPSDVGSPLGAGGWCEGVAASCRVGASSREDPARAVSEAGDLVERAFISQVHCAREEGVDCAGAGRRAWYWVENRCPVRR
jgi:hypothetical protein